MSGAVQPASSIRCLISGTACAASGRLTVTRTISEPASASSMHCRAVPRASAVSVIVIDCTTTGAPPPTWTSPTRTPTVLWSFTNDIEDPMVASRDREPLKGSRDRLAKSALGLTDILVTGALMTRLILAFAVAGVAAMPLAAQRQADPDKKVAGGGTLPSGWKGRVDGTA